MLGRMVFLVGARRSGTNWVHRILATHPDLVATPTETYIFAEGIAPLASLIQHAHLRSPTTARTYAQRDAFIDAVRDLCDRIFGDLLRGLDPAASRLVERTPGHVHHLDLITAVYPDAYVIHVIRDGRDVARSLLAQPWGPETMEEAAAEWRTSVEAGRSLAGQSRYIEVRYDQVLADPVSAAQALFRGLDLEITAPILQSVAQEAAAEFNVDTSQPGISAGKWQSGLDAGQIDTFERVAGDLLAELGFAAGTPATPVAPRSSNTPLFTRLRGRLGNRRRMTTRVFTKELDRRVRAGQLIVERFLQAVAVGDLAEIRATLADDVQVHVMGDGRSYEGRGAAAIERLLTTIDRDQAVAWPQVAGRVHPSAGNYTAVMSYAADGRRADRAVVLAPQGQHLARVSYYQFPLGGTTD